MGKNPRRYCNSVRTLVSFKVKLAEVEACEKRLFRFEEYQKAKAGEARLRAELTNG